MEGLSRLISNSRVDGSFGGVNIDVSYLTHLLFVDDVLIFLYGSIRDTTCFKNVLSLFCKATGMVPNYKKSNIMLVSFLQKEKRHALHQFQFTRQEMEAGLKYLGFILKPNDYRFMNWTWVIAKIEGHIKVWQHRWLSREGILTLIKYLLEAIPVD